MAAFQEYPLVVYTSSGPFSASFASWHWPYARQQLPQNPIVALYDSYLTSPYAIHGPSNGPDAYGLEVASLFIVDLFGEEKTIYQNNITTPL